MYKDIFKSNDSSIVDINNLRDFEDNIINFNNSDCRYSYFNF